MKFIDQLNRNVVIRSNPERIISLVPSQTELLFDLGLGDKVIGVTKFCIHPPEAIANRTVIGGTKNIDVEKIKTLKPDLIIANKEENEHQAISTLEQLFPVWVSNVTDRSSAMDMIATLGEMLHCNVKANELINQINANFQGVQKRQNQNTLYLIWRDPFMAAGTDTFIHAMITEMGLKNAVSTIRYPSLTKEELIAINPAVIMLSSEPYPFKEKHQHELQSWLPNAIIILVDGEMFSWYGSRMRLAPDYYNSLSLSRNQF